MRVSQLLCAACCVVAVTASADVIEIDVTVKAVDAKARKITVARNTAKGERVKTLDVARKAGDISELAEGQVVSITYDPELGVVAKVKPRLSSAAAAEAPMPREPKSLTLYKFSGDEVATAEEAKAMLLWLGATITGRDPGDGWVTGRLRPDLEITIWPKTYGKDRCYGVRFGNPDAGGATPESYFEVCRNQSPAVPDEKQAPPIDPTTIERLTPEEARRLAQATTSFEICLPRLTSLSPELAAALRCESAVTRHEVRTVTYYVNVCKEQSPGVTTCVPEKREKAITLTRIGTDLRLDGIVELSDAAAAALASHNGLLSLNGVRSISPAALRSLAAHNGRLSLNGLKGLDVARADVLSAQRMSLSLDGVSELSNEAAASLAKHQGQLTLNGLSSLTAIQAKALSGHKGGLSLNGIRVLPDDVAVELASHEGLLSLNGVTQASGQAVKSLVNLASLPPDIVAKAMKEKE